MLHVACKLWVEDCWQKGLNEVQSPLHVEHHANMLGETVSVSKRLPSKQTRQINGSRGNRSQRGEVAQLNVSF